MRPTRGPSLAMPALAVPALAVVPLLAVLAACSSSDQQKLPVFTGGSGTSSSAPTTSSGTPATTTATSSTPPTTAANGFPLTNTITRGEVAASIPASSQPAVDAYYAYWRYVAKASLDPAAPGVLENIGTVATGSAASTLLSTLGGLKGRSQHTVGSTTVNVSSLTESGGAAAVCSPVQDSSVDLDAQGIPVEAPIAKFVTFKATLVKQGPDWLVATNVTVPSC